MRADAVFTALADATRREVVASLAQQGPRTATELSAEMPITRQAVAKHLTHLHRAQLVTPERRGRETRYRLTPAPLSEAIDWLEDLFGDAADERAA
ncbi:MAG: ArsR family transcriptional regulator [Solirubrobacterales bacterium]|jgi:DNA-binding transcriptional ArsR family regulator|nr:ArsR family transcriptional regulator [Solirubrobacterales bacterium]